jgi:hypothetical protein
MRIEANDRRFNVCPRQERQLLEPDESGEDLVGRIKDELPAFADYLMSREADRAKARQALDNEAKRRLQTVTQTAIEEVAKAFRDGDLAYFVESRPTDLGGLPRCVRFDGREFLLNADYERFLNEALDAAAENRKHIVSHQRLFVAFELLVGDMPKSKTKLTKRLGHQNLHVEPQSRAGTSVRGLGVTWAVEPQQVAEWRDMLKEAEPLRQYGVYGSSGERNTDAQGSGGGNGA